MNFIDIDSYHSRAVVPGGWIVKCIEPVVHNCNDMGRGMESGWDFRVAMVFVPDSNHDWVIEEG